MVNINKNKNGTATNVMLLIFVRVVTTVISLAITKLIATSFSLSEYGTYSQAELVKSTVVSFSILGLIDASNYFYNSTNDIDEQRTSISTIFFIQYVVGGSCAVIIILLRNVIAKGFNNPDLSEMMFLIALMPLLGNVCQIYQTLYVSIGKAKYIAIRNFIVMALKLLAVLLACFLTKKLHTVLAVILIVDIVQIIYFALGFKKAKFKISIAYAKFSYIKKILSFSIPMMMYILTNTLSRDLDKYVISIMAGTAPLAIYTNASKPLPFDILTTSLITILVPIITRQLNEKKYVEVEHTFKLYLKLSYITTFILVGGAIALSENLMIFLYDTKYLAGLTVFIIYLFVDMLKFANITTILSAAGKTKLLMVISFLILLVNAILNVVFFMLFGFCGPAIATLLLTFLSSLLLLHFGAKEMKSKISKLFDFKEMLIILVQIIIVGACAVALSTFLKKIGMWYVFSLVLSYGSYLLIMGLLNLKRLINCFKDINSLK